MKRWIRLAARLYPAPWRERYAAEFDALLDDAKLRWRDVADVLRGAAIMRMTKWNSYWKTAAVTAIAGAILAWGISFTLRDQWTASASIRVTSESNASEFANRISQISSAAFARDQLVQIIQDPLFDLYPQERRSYPVETVADRVFRRDIRVASYAPGAIRIEFRYPDRLEAQAVVRELISRFMSAGTRLGAPLTNILITWEPPPLSPVYPNQRAITLFGTFAGMLTGSLALLIYRRAHRYSVLNIALSEDMRSVVASRIAEGPYRDPGEYIRALIHADQEHKGGR